MMTEWENSQSRLALFLGSVDPLRAKTFTNPQTVSSESAKGIMLQEHEKYFSSIVLLSTSKLERV